MATRSRIGIQLADGSVLSVYHHWDGYPEWLGRILRTHYNDRSKVAELIDGGDMSSAWTNCGWNNETRPTTGPLYYSERGEEYQPPRLDENKYEYLGRNNSGEEYAYLFVNNEWICYNLHLFEENTMPTIAEIPSGALMA
jgi:hypothetical protein